MSAVVESGSKRSVPGSFEAYRVGGSSRSTRMPQALPRLYPSQTQPPIVSDEPRRGEFDWVPRLWHSRKGGRMKRLALILVVAVAMLVVVGWLTSEQATEES
jgi:hypothetical protein